MKTKRQKMSASCAKTLKYSDRKDTKNELKNKSTDSLSEHVNVKVDQQTNSHLYKFHISQNLRLMNFEQLIHAFQLND
jgi:hypothetical protein